MDLIAIFLIAVSLALDAFAVSVSSGISVPGFGWRQAVKMGCWFGAFQFLMPLLGWALGSSVSRYIEAVDHWIAFALLAILGINMLREARSGDTEEASASLGFRVMFAMAVATSIDALAVGVSMAFMPVDILSSAGIIGIVAFVLSVVGGLVGRRLGCLFQRRAELVGGLVLIGIGVKILCEHLMG